MEAKLTLPPEADLPDLSVRDLHSIWRANEPRLVELASELDLERLPFLVVHGSAADRIRSLAEGLAPVMWTFAAYERIRDTRELVRNLYCLTSGGSGYSFYANENGGPIKDEAGMMCFGTENNKQFFDWHGNLRDAWKHGRTSDSFPQAMPRAYRLPKASEEAEFQGYVSEKLDNKTECDFFDFRKDPPKVMAFDRFKSKREDQRIAIFDADTPKHLLRSHDPEPCANSYRQEILRRLFCQNLSAIIISKLRHSMRLQKA